MAFEAKPLSGHKELARKAVGVCGVELPKSSRPGFQRLGWVEGRGLPTFYQHDTLPTPEDLARAATDLVRLNPKVIVTAGNPATEAVKAATDNIPVVFGVANDPGQARVGRRSVTPWRQCDGASDNGRDGPEAA